MGSTGTDIQFPFPRTLIVCVFVLFFEGFLCTLTMCVCLQVIHRHFYLKRAEIMAQCEGWICDIQQYSSDKRVGRTMSHHAAALKVQHVCHTNVTCGICCVLGTDSMCFMQRHTAQLREELLKLPCPEGLEPDGEEFSEKSTSLLVKELPGQDAEKQTDSPDAHCSDGQL